MASPAKLHSVDALKHLRVALMKFAEEIAGSLGIMHQEVIRLTEWINHDQPSYWKKQIQVGFDKVAQARAQLAKAKLKTVGGRTPTCYEEKKELAKAKKFLEHAQQQVEVVRHWCGKIQQESDEYRGRLGRLEHMTSLEIPKMIALLENMVRAVEEYIAIQSTVTSQPIVDPAMKEQKARTSSAASQNVTTPIQPAPVAETEEQDESPTAEQETKA